MFDADALVAEALTLARRTEGLPRDLIERAKRTMTLASASSHRAAFEHESEEQMHSLQQPPFQELVARLKGELAAKP
ncbi:hypothetical protein [Sphingobium sp. CECT 9361]|uniref:hypothetical protein n=1 Tax=Sphingobium sp. CECT 9361 TaxID=2845384 RepID=UPI001E410F94|nr:hypothetical protein [Sphingobium sp. CECT 9361]